VTVEVDIEPYTVILARLQDGTHPGQTPAWTNPPADLDPTNEWLQTHVPGASANLSAYDYQPVTDIVETMKVTLDTEERVGMAREVLEILLGVHPDHPLDGFTGQPAVMNGIQRAVRWPYVHVSDDWFQFAHNSHLFDTSWLDQNHPDAPA
jgi:ABC-type transport system substrate-binding protein